MNKILEKEITCNMENASASSQLNFIPSIFEGLFPERFINLSNPKRWKNLFSTSIILYIFALVIYYGSTVLFNDYFLAVNIYNSAAPIVASIIFWPFIIMYNCELFYHLYLDLRPLFKDTDECDKWYTQNAHCNFSLFCSKSKGFWFPVLLNFLMVIVSTILFCANSKGLINLPLVLNYVVFLFPLLVSIIITWFSTENKNIHTVLLVVNGGLAYYIYILQFAKEKVPYLIKPDYIFGNLIIIALVVIAFFIAGSTISPMIGLFKMFYLTKFEEKICYPIKSIACSLDRINKIKRYFFHLTGITVLAYFQLLGCVYFLGILNTNSLVTILLFSAGSLFPFAMYLATNVFFKNLVHKIYCLQVKKIDILLSDELSKTNFDSDKIQALVDVKGMYSEEFEIHVEINKDVFIAMLSPLATTIIAFVFPFVN